MVSDNLTCYDADNIRPWLEFMWYIVITIRIIFLKMLKRHNKAQGFTQNPLTQRNNN